VYQNPFGSADEAPIVGKLGTGVELNELFTSFEQGSLKETESDFDIALDGKGFLSVVTPTVKGTPGMGPSNWERRVTWKPRRGIRF